MRLNTLSWFATVTVALALTGCASGQSASLMTSSVGSSAKKQAAAPAVDPACTTLAAKINTIREEGTPQRVNAASEGKTKIVRIKRASLAKVAELDRLNAEFQAKCSKLPTQSASLKPAAKTDKTEAKAKKLSQKTAETTAQTTAKPVVAKRLSQIETKQVATQPIVTVPKQ